jgi:hypothetical protein
MLRVLKASAEPEWKEGLLVRLREGFKVLHVAKSVSDDREPSFDHRLVWRGWARFFLEVSKTSGIDAATLLANIEIRHTDAPLPYAGVIELSNDTDGAADFAPHFLAAQIQMVRFSDEEDDDLMMRLEHRFSPGLMSFYSKTVWNVWSRAKRWNFLAGQDPQEESAIPILLPPQS